MLLPVVKGWCSENAWRVLGSESLQTLGGSGFLRDHPLEQYVRDTKIDAIYEGATGIQALDLLPRRLLRDRGVAVGELLSDIVSSHLGMASNPLVLRVIEDRLNQPEGKWWPKAMDSSPRKRRFLSQGLHVA